MHLIICNERLLFRFGVDRVLLLLAQGLKAAGWHITFVAQRANHDVLRRITDDVHTPPEHQGPTLNWTKLPPSGCGPTAGCSHLPGAMLMALSR